MLDVDREKVEAMIKGVRKEGRIVLLENEAKAIISAYGISTLRYRLVSSKGEAVKAAEDIGYPVVMKVVSPDIMHKTDVGGILTDIRSKREVEEAYDRILANVHRYVPRAWVYGILVERMAETGTEAIVGVTKDFQFGHMIMFGSGGIYAELFKDVAFDLTPLSKEEAMDLIGRTKIYSILRGYRGMKPLDIDSILNVLVRVSRLVTDFPEIVEMDINPLRVYEAGRGALPLDVKIILSKGG